MTINSTKTMQNPLSKFVFPIALALALFLGTEAKSQALQSPAANGTPALIAQLKNIGAKINTEGNAPDGDVVEITFKYAHTPRQTLDGMTVPPYSMTDDLLAQVSKLPKLTHLELNMCTQLTDTGLAHLKNMTQLQALALPGARVTDATMSNLVSLTKLSYFRMTGAKNLTSAGWAVIQNWKNLQTFWVAEGSFKDEDMPYLKGLTQLRDITFWGDNVTDSGAEVLLNLPNLTSVRVSDKITPAAVAKLRTALPNCRFWR
jgi:hypothetical protein